MLRRARRWIWKASCLSAPVSMLRARRLHGPDAGETRTAAARQVFDRERLQEKD